MVWLGLATVGRTSSGVSTQTTRLRTSKSSWVSSTWRGKRGNFALTYRMKISCQLRGCFPATRDTLKLKNKIVFYASACIKYKYERESSKSSSFVRGRRVNPKMSAPWYSQLRGKLNVKYPFKFRKAAVCPAALNTSPNTASEHIGTKKV